MREIKYSNEFNEAVEKLGGYRFIDPALGTIMDGLYGNPYGYTLVENDWVRFRYAVTKPIGNVPSLVVLFTIDGNNDVILEHIEEKEGY